jgi:hypothetical protein
MFRNWKNRILPPWQWKSGLLLADMLKLWKTSTRVEHEMDSVMKRITINADDDDDTSESTVCCDEKDDIQGVVPIVSDS